MCQHNTSVHNNQNLGAISRPADHCIMARSCNMSEILKCTSAVLTRLLSQCVNLCKDTADDFDRLLKRAPEPETVVVQISKNLMCSTLVPADEPGHKLQSEGFKDRNLQFDKGGKETLNGAADRSRFIYRKVPLKWRDSSHTLQAAFSSDMTDTERKALFPPSDGVPLVLQSLSTNQPRVFNSSCVT